MKKLSILFVLLTCSIISAKTTDELYAIVQDYYKIDLPSVYARVEAMKNKGYFTIKRENDSKPYVIFNNIYFHRIGSDNDQHKKIALLVIADYISHIRKSDKRLKHINFTHHASGTFAQYSTLSDDIYYVHH